MKETLVIGLYEDTGQTFTHTAQGVTRQEALRSAAAEAGALADQLILLGSISSEEGGSMAFEPAVDLYNGAVYAEELLGGGDDDSTA